MIVVDVKRAQIVERCRSRGGIVTGIDSVISQSAGWGAVAVCAYLLPGLLATLVAESVGPAGRFADIALSLYPRVARSALRTVVAAVVGLAGALQGRTAGRPRAPPPPPPRGPRPAPPPPPIRSTGRCTRPKRLHRPRRRVPRRPRCRASRSAQATRCGASPRAHLGAARLRRRLRQLGRAGGPPTGPPSATTRI